MSDAVKQPFSDSMGLIEKFGLTVVDGKEAEELEAKERQQEEEDRKERLLSHYRSIASGVPSRYHREGLDTFQTGTDERSAALKTVIMFVRSRGCRILILCGKPGTGKTHLGCGIIRERGGIYIPMLRLVYEVDSTMSFKSRETKVQLLDRLCESPMLVLDEIGRMKVREDFQKELAAYVIGERYANGLPTVLISNLNKRELVGWLETAVMDRLNECGEVIEMNGTSYRASKRAEVFDKGEKC